MSCPAFVPRLRSAGRRLASPRGQLWPIIEIGSQAIVQDHRAATQRPTVWPLAQLRLGGYLVWGVRRAASVAAGCPELVLSLGATSLAKLSRSMAEGRVPRRKGMKLSDGTCRQVHGCPAA